MTDAGRAQRDEERPVKQLSLVCWALVRHYLRHLKRHMFRENESAKVVAGVFVLCGFSDDRLVCAGDR